MSQAQTPGEFLIVRGLFEQYRMALGLDLGFQNFETELDSLSAMYGPPRGCLLLAYRDGTAVGCVGLRPFQGTVCEMKRLYVRPQARGLGLGKTLAQNIIERARVAGYSRMVLDTLRSMSAARQLYRSLGFYETPPYYENPIDGAVYMALEIDRTEPIPPTARR